MGQYRQIASPNKGGIHKLNDLFQRADGHNTHILIKAAVPKLEWATEAIDQDAYLDNF